MQLQHNVGMLGGQRLRQAHLHPSGRDPGRPAAREGSAGQDCVCIQSLCFIMCIIKYISTYKDINVCVGKEGRGNRKAIEFVVALLFVCLTFTSQISMDQSYLVYIWLSLITQNIGLSFKKNVTL